MIKVLSEIEGSESYKKIRLDDKNLLKVSELAYETEKRFKILLDLEVSL